MHVVILCNLPSAIAHAAHFASTIRRSGSAVPIAGDLNLHHELRDGCSPSTASGENLAATPSGMESELSDDPAQAARISGRHILFPDVTAQRALRVSHWTSTCLHGVGSPSAIPQCRDGGRHPATGRHAATTEHAAFVLRAADSNACTSACETLLATVTTWLEMHRGTVRAARRTIPCGSRDSSHMYLDGRSVAGRVHCSGSMQRAHCLTRRQPAPS
ncbi:hypothetical protein TcYC6_0056000 [Trypanosoma cruzi]|nr:hypothetical protein TcYC6_0056000 [Trypanosoma cruzi]